MDEKATAAGQVRLEDVSSLPAGWPASPLLVTDSKYCQPAGFWSILGLVPSCGLAHPMKTLLEASHQTPKILFAPGKPSRLAGENVAEEAEGIIQGFVVDVTVQISDLRWQSAGLVRPSTVSLLRGLIEIQPFAGCTR